MRRPIIAGNWKMHTTLEEALGLTRELLPSLVSRTNVERVLIPPFPWLVPMVELLRDTDVRLGAQDCAVEDQGAFTGEVSAKMLAPFCRYIIVGHSERRHILGETDELVAAKLRAALRNRVRPILCVGELLEERQRGEANSVVQRQLRSALDGREPDEVATTVIAYEPVWAIGTGHAATPEDAQGMAVTVRTVVADLAGGEVAEHVIIQYGGSVNASNAGSILSLADIDGALVGGASLKAGEFASIVDAAEQGRL